MRVKPRSKKAGFEFEGDGTLVLKIHEPPVDGKANKAVIEQIAEIYDLSKSAVRIVSGETGRTKRVEIPDGSTPRRV
ncbi:MAG: DUF167 domain-containing protein [Spirochaetota bacterium]